MADPHRTRLKILESNDGKPRWTWKCDCGEMSQTVWPSRKSAREQADDHRAESVDG